MVKSFTKKSIFTGSLKNTFGEVTQAKIRIGLHSLFVILTFAAYQFDSRISFNAVVIVSVASFASAFGLYIWAVQLQNRASPIKLRNIQRGASILSDNLFVTLVLAIGGQSTAGLWAIYIWTSIGYGVRFGIPYLHANVAVSATSFALLAYLTPFWHERPPFVLGMLLGMVLVPLYTGFLIRQLHRAVQERETAYAAKSEFLARMSHELRTPLHAIISTAELLKGKAQSAIQNDYVDTIALSSTTLLELINRVLDLSKFESGQIGLAKEGINIHQLLADAASILFQQTQTKGIAIRLYSDSLIPLNLLGSPAHVREVLLNILGNAVKFTDSGFVSISAIVTSDTEVSTQISFEVVDTGCGIPERDLARIFEPFVQSDQTITRKHGGTGLGTSFSREILRLMGGEIWISSTEGLGTTVRFSIPFQKSPEALFENPPANINLAVLGSRAGALLVKDAVREFGLSVQEFDTTNDLLNSLSKSESIFRIDAVFVDAGAYGHILPKVPASIAGLGLSRIVPVIGFGDPSIKTVAVTSGYCSYINSTSLNNEFRSVLAIVESFCRKGVMHSRLYDEKQVSRSLKILVADDNATNRKIAKIALEEAGHSCTLVTNGDDALFALNDVEYDVALLDMHMPGRDGIEVAKIYRFAGFDRESPIPIILLTADCTTQAREDAESAGISKFLTKPILPSEIVRIVEEVGSFRQPHAHDSSSTSVEPSVPLQSHSSRARLLETSEPISVGLVLNKAAVAELVALMSKAEQTEFFSEFCEDAAGYLDVLKRARSATEVGPVREAMHALAGAALIIGANLLADTARRVEKAEAGLIVIHRSQLFAELADAYRQTVEELSRLFPSVRR